MDRNKHAHLYTCTTHTYILKTVWEQRVELMESTHMSVIVLFIHNIQQATRLILTKQGHEMFFIADIWQSLKLDLLYILPTETKCQSDSKSLTVSASDWGCESNFQRWKGQYFTAAHMSVNCSQKWKALGVLSLVSSSHFANSTTLYFWEKREIFILSADHAGKLKRMVKYRFDTF